MCAAAGPSAPHRHALADPDNAEGMASNDDNCLEMAEDEGKDMAGRTFRGLMALSSTIALAIGLSSPARAQTAPAAAPAAAPATDDGSSIIVTARRVEERLQDVPISITVFSQQQITNRNITNSADLATYTPSLSTNSNFGSENTSFAIRGFVQDAGTAPSVGVYFADVVAPRGPTQGTQAGDGAGPGTLFDLQNVQVLKGPQGTLFGRNTTGGAILFVPQKPTSKFEGYFEGSYGNYDMKRLQGAVNIPLSDTARFRISGDYQNRDGFIKNDSGFGDKDYNDINYFALRASLVVDLTPDLENYLIVSYDKSDTNGSAQKLIGCINQGLGTALFCPQFNREKNAGFYTVSSNYIGAHSNIEQWQVIDTTTWRASDTLTVKNIVSYAQFTDNQRSPLFATDINITAGPLGILHVPFASITAAPGLDTADQSTFTEEFQVQGSLDDQKLTYQAGAYLESSLPLGTVGGQSSTFTPCPNIALLQCYNVLGFGSASHILGRTEYHDVGLYAQANYALTDRLKLTGGIRYTWDRQQTDTNRMTFTFPRFPPGGPAMPSCTDATTAPSCNEDLREKSRAPTWIVDVDYKPIDDILLYAKYSRGYRAGGVFPNAPSDLRVFRPEKVDAYEAGIKTTFHGRVHGTFNVAGFYNDFSNQQLQVGYNAAPPPRVSPTTAIVNAGKSRIYGAEVEASVTPFRGLTIDGSYTYLHTRIVSINIPNSVDPNYVISNEILPGDPLVLSPKNKFSVTGAYTLPLDPGIGRITLAATFTHTDKQLSTYQYNVPGLAAAIGGDLGELPSYNLVNLNLDWNSIAGSQFDAAVFATNVNDKKYYAFVAGLASGLNAEFAVLGQPRMYGGRLRYHF
jgi:iron complex outermembrane receptor protein